LAMPHPARPPARPKNQFRRTETGDSPCRSDCYPPRGVTVLDPHPKPTRVGTPGVPGRAARPRQGRAIRERAEARPLPCPAERRPVAIQQPDEQRLAAKILDRDR
jgi:hypothetical protein